MVSTLITSENFSWGTELWDQYDNIAAHTQRGIDFLEKCGHFFKERCAIEMEYAAKLRRLVKSYHPKKKEEDDYQFTSCKGFVLMMNEVNDLAGQHEVIAENFGSIVIKGLCTFVKDLKEERKRHLLDGSKLQNNLQTSLFLLEKSKRSYEKAFKEAEKAEENYQKADADLNLSRAEVEKARNLNTLKAGLCEDGKNEYASQLQKTNDLQAEHYTKLIPEIFQQLQLMDETRVKQLQHYIKQSADIERQVCPIIHQCLDEITKAANSIDPKEDSRLVVEKFKSGFQPPEEIPFEDLSNMRNGSGSIDTGKNSPSVSISTIRSDSLTLKGTLSATRLKKRGGIFGFFASNKNNTFETKDDYCELPPTQRKKKLQQKIDQINAQIQQETSARDGLTKMKVVYEQNNALGDPLSIEGQLTENGHKLDKLRQDLHKYQSYMADADGTASSPSSQKHKRNSVSEDSLSRSASDSSMSNPMNNNCNKMSVTRSPLPLPPCAPTIMEAPTAQPEYTNDEDECDGGEFEDVDQLPVLGMCKALYHFEAQSEGSIPMSDGEEFQVIELDQGDGWTRVRRENNEEGFVPTSYIECFLYMGV